MALSGRRSLRRESAMPPSSLACLYTHRRSTPSLPAVSPAVRSLVGSGACLGATGAVSVSRRAASSAMAAGIASRGSTSSELRTFEGVVTGPAEPNSKCRSCRRAERLGSEAPRAGHHTQADLTVCFPEIPFFLPWS